MHTVQNRTDPGEPPVAELPAQPSASWAARGLVQALMPHLQVQRVAGDVAWFPPIFDGLAPPLAPVAPGAVYELIAAAIGAGAPAPVMVEFKDSPSGGQLEVQLPDNDRTGVTLYATLFALPLPTESGFQVHTRRGMGAAQLFGASTARRVPGEENLNGLAQALKRTVSVWCYVPFTAPPAAAVGVAQVAPAIQQVIA